MIRYEVGSATDIGKKKFEEGKVNEDARSLDESVGLFIIADGVSGNLSGAEASRKAIRLIQEEVRARRTEGMLEEDIREMLVGSINSANDTMYLESSSLYPELDSNRYPATTVTVLLIDDKNAYVAHVGNSRAHYIYKSGLTAKNAISEEDSPVDYILEGRLDAGSISFAEYVRDRLLSPSRGVCAVIGVKAGVDVGFEQRPLSELGYVILSTDGLTDNATDREIRNIVLCNKPQDSARKLVGLANEPKKITESVEEILKEKEYPENYVQAMKRGIAGNDNITVIVVKLE